MFKLEIETGNAAFGDDRPEEIARILRDVAKRLVNDRYPYGDLRDINGNKVGEFVDDEC